MPALEVPDPPLADDVVALRAFTLEDVDWIVRACRDPEIPRYTLVPDPYEPEDARGWIGLHEGERERGEALALAVVDAEDGEPLGSAGLQRIDWVQGRGEVGYWVAPWARGRGAATSATRLLAAHAFALGLARVEIPVYVDNRPHSAWPRRPARSVRACCAPTSSPAARATTASPTRCCPATLASVGSAVARSRGRRSCRRSA